MPGRTASRRGRGTPPRAALLLLLATFLVGVVAAGPAAAAEPRLLLTPSAAEAGKPVHAVVSGYDDCTRPGLRAVRTPGTVQLTWDDGPVLEAGAPVTDGQATVDLTVPDAAAPGPHVLVADCVEIPGKLRVESPPFTVLEPTTSTTPATPTTTTATTPATPTPTVATPTTVLPTQAPVPDLRGKTATEARAALEDVGLRLGVVDRTAVRDGVGVVARQDPLAGTSVGLRSKVDVALAAVVPAVTVPDVVGLTGREADRVLDAAGLRVTPIDAADLDRRVTGQRPAAGAAVPAASTVDVSLSSAASQPSPSWRGTFVVLAGLAAAGLLGRRLLRGRHGRRWVAEHVDVRPTAGDRHAEAATHRTSSEHDLAVGLQGHPDDQGSQTLEEVHR